MSPGTRLGPLDDVLAAGVVAVVRLRAERNLIPLAEAMAEGGVRGIEVTLTTPGAIKAIAALASRSGAPYVVGAGSVLGRKLAKDVLDAGARFVVSPVFDADVVALCEERGIPCLPGAFSPTEIVTAWRAGATVVKVFPSSAVTPGYFRDVLAPLPFVRLMPSGGVTLENAAEWIRAGAAAISVGSALADPTLIAAGRESEIVARARGFVSRVAEARQAMGGGAQ